MSLRCAGEEAEHDVLEKAGPVVSCFSLYYEDEKNSLIESKAMLAQRVL